MRVNHIWIAMVLPTKFIIVARWVTGCVGCPFSKHTNEELAIIEKYEQNLYKAAVNIFGKSYKYTKKYREFVKMMKAKEKEQKHDKC